MKRYILILILINKSFCLFSQNWDSSTISNDFIIGAWYDSSKVNTGGFGFIFTPDSCCSLIIDGEMTECVVESKNMKVNYNINYLTTPRQIDIKFIDIPSDSIIVIFPFIFEIIDYNHIRIANDITLNKRAINFTESDQTEISILTRYIKKEGE